MDAASVGGASAEKVQEPIDIVQAALDALEEKCTPHAFNGSTYVPISPDDDRNMYKCVNPYNRSGATNITRRKSCSKAGPPHASFQSNRYRQIQPCIEACTR